MKKFVLKYSPIIWILLGLIAVIFSAAAVLNILDAVSFAGEIGTKFIFSLIVAFFSVVILILIISALLYGRYVIREKYLYFHFGLIFTKTDINDVFQLTHFKAQNKLVIYFKNEKYAVAIIDRKYYNDFYDALKAVNPDIIFTVNAADEDNSVS